jgi:predicted DNA-binding ribbon-helix-helix protein
LTAICNYAHGGVCMKSLIVKRSIVIADHKTSVSLEETFWKTLKEIGIGRNMGLSAMVAAIDSERQYGNLSSAIRLFVLNFYRDQLDSGSREEAIGRIADFASQQESARQRNEGAQTCDGRGLSR